VAGKKLAGILYTTPKFRANWVYIFKPRPDRDGQAKKPQYSITCLFEKGQDLKELKKAIIAAGAEAWGPDRKKWPPLKSTVIKDQGDCIRKREDGTEYLPDGYTPGALYMEAKTYTPPGIIDKGRQAILDEGDFYSGCYARAQVIFKAYSYKGDGITCYLQHVQKWADGESLGGRTKPEDAFSAIETDDEDFETPTEKDDVDDMLGV